jgi:hypothetical protein
VRIDPNAHDAFVLRQRFAPVVNRYEFSVPGEEEPFGYVQQKRFTFKEDIRFFSDRERTQEVLRIKARQRFDPRARYDVTTADGTKVGEIQKVFGKSLLRSSYALFDSSGAEVATARERSLVIALFRRLVGLIPLIGDLADWLPIPYHFDFRRGEQELGTHRRRIGRIGDVYDIDMSGDPERTVDRRLVLALAVGMVALQAR